MNVVSYGKDIWQAISSTFEGMAVTFSHLVRKPMTIQYPDRIPVPIQDTLPFRYRGILEVDLEICTGCLACERACPIDCIIIDIEKDKETKAASIDPLRHRHVQVHVLRALLRAVPDRADPPLAGVRRGDYNLASLVRHFAPQPLNSYKPKKGGETDPELVTNVERGMRYLDEFATPDGGAAAADESSGLRRGGELDQRPSLLIQIGSSGI